MSQGDLAKAIFVSRQTISNWETDRTYPDVQSLILLCKLFGTTIDALVADDAAQMQTAIIAGSKKMNRLGMIMTVFGIAAVAWVFATALMNMDTALIIAPAAALFAPAAIAAFMADKMRRDNQLYTYRTLEAFLSGENPDVLDSYNQRAGEHWTRKRILKTIIALPFGFCLGWGLFSIILRLLGR